VPDTEQLVNEAKGIELDIDFAEGEEKISLEATKTGKIWRTLRIASRNKLNRFEKLEDTGNIDILLDKPAGETQENANEEAQDNNLDDTIQTGKDISMPEQTSITEEEFTSVQTS
jgi:THO complex subunit 1